MKVIRSLEFHAGSKEEKLPDFASNFPYIATRAELDYYKESLVPWHWHKAVELFYMESGELKYYTPNKVMTFPAGSGGMVNSNVLHMTKIGTHRIRNIQLLHLFDPILIGGQCGSLIEQKYIAPITAASQLEIIPLYPDNPLQADILHLIQKAFQLSENEFDYEWNIREYLSRIWFRLLKLSFPTLQETSSMADKATDKIKLMMAYIHEHYAEKISVSMLAAAAFLSERECYRVFHKCLHMTPTDYMKNYRLQMACQMLADSHEPVTSISYSCGLGNSSYFSKVFRAHIGCTPLEYRQKRQNINKK